MRPPERDQDECFSRDAIFILKCSVCSVAISVILMGITLGIRNCVGDDMDEGGQSSSEIIPTKD